MNNRHPIKQWFITFPQTEVTKEEFVGTLPAADYVYCVREEHKEGGWHLHCIAKLRKGITKSKLGDWFKAKYPEDYKRIDYDAIKSMEHSVAYCTKEDPEPLVQGTLEKRVDRLESKVKRLVEASEANKAWERRLEQRDSERAERDERARVTEYFYHLGLFEKWLGQRLRAQDISEDHEDFNRSELDGATYFKRHYPKSDM